MSATHAERREARTLILGHLWAIRGIGAGVTSHDLAELLGLRWALVVGVLGELAAEDLAHASAQRRWQAVGLPPYRSTPGKATP